MSEGVDYDMKKSFLYPMNYNIILNGLVSIQWLICAMSGSWGMIFYNDGGEMMNACFTLGLQGGMAEYFTLTD
jgi:hypothetical protein